MTHFILTLVFWAGLFILSWVVYGILAHFFGDHVASLTYGIGCAAVLIWDTVTLQSVTTRAVDLGLAGFYLWIWWKRRPPKNRGRIRRAVGARVQAILDRMQERIKPAGGQA